jgi:hypothetical protein
MERYCSMHGSGSCGEGRLEAEERKAAAKRGNADSGTAAGTAASAHQAMAGEDASPSKTTQTVAAFSSQAIATVRAVFGGPDADSVSPETRLLVFGSLIAGTALLVGIVAYASSRAGSARALESFFGETERRGGTPLSVRRVT